jgi:hypothetical protein
LYEILSHAYFSIFKPAHMKLNLKIPKAKSFFGFLLICSFLIVHQSCTKINTDASAKLAFTDAEVTQKFFALPANASLAVKRAAAEMQKRNATSEFVAAFVKKNGYPLWDKATVVAGTGIATKANSSSATQEGDTLVVVPVLQDSSSTVKSFINITLSGEVSLAFYRGGDYSVYSYDDVPEDSINADKAAIQIMWLNYKVFGATKFIVNDDKLFMDGAAVYTGPHPRIIKIDPPTTPVLQGRFLMVQICNQIPTIQGCSCWHHDITQCTCTIPNCCWRQSCWYIYFPPYDDSPGGSGGGSGDPTGGGGGGSGGDFPCASSQGRTIGIADPCGGSNPPPVVPILPYVCNYQLTQHESDIFNQIDEEDAVANNNQNSECHGTNRTGNANFQGTKEHWLIQLDYVCKNSVYGEVEYAIPGASIANPANKGFADMVNTSNGNIFEIKPNNLAGVTNGMAEVENYVAKAILNCSSNLPFGTVWNKGTIYQPTYLPTATPDRYLEATLMAPGVVGYKYVNLSYNPSPSPVPIPSSVFDKLKQLIERLKANTANADRIIGEFMGENPDLVNGIKAAALSAGISIIVGTIIEDVLTAGAGILDDLASFALAYRIIRFAVKVA